MPRYSCSCKWMPASTELPTFCGGYSGPGEAMYVARFHHSNDILPGYISGVSHTARSSYGGQQRESTDYEVLVESYPHEFAWIPAASGSVPDGAVRGGVTASGEILYISRVHSQGYFMLGKVHPSHGCCYYPFAGKELKSNNYEVLVCGLIMHHDHENTSYVSSEGVTDSELDEHDCYYDSDY